jgi:carboxyl-terminal processing protease
LKAAAYNLGMSSRGRLAIALATLVVVAYSLGGFVLGRVLGDTTYGQLALFNEVLRIVLEAYVEPVNVDRAMNGARLGLTDALDGDSAYLDAEEFRAWQAAGRENDAEIGVILSRRVSFLMVVTARAGSPAQKAGIRPGDLVKTIDGRHSRPLSAVAGQRLLRGAPGSVVKLTLLRVGSDPVSVDVVRERLTPIPATGRMLDGGAAYVKVAEFTPKVTDEVRADIEGFKRAGARQLVLDLRGAGHGELSEGVKMAELFMRGGVVAKVAGAKAEERVLNADPARSVWDRPMAVLTDNGTSGAGEIVAAALLDAGRASVVGEPTFGRAPIQRAVVLPEGGLVLTVARYVSPKGTAIHGKGVTPSVPVEDRAAEDSAEGAPAGDPILEKDLEVLRGEIKKAA